MAVLLFFEGAKVHQYMRIIVICGNRIIIKLL